MLVNSVTNFNYGSSKMAHKAVTKPEPQPVQDQGLTASVYFTGKKNDGGNGMRKAAMAGLGSLVLLTSVPSLTSCDKDEAWAVSESTSSSSSSSSASASDSVWLNVHGKGCHCDSCCHGKDTVYVYLPGETEYIYLPGDTVKLPGDTIHDTIPVPVEVPIYVYVDTGSYHVTHDTIVQWKDRFVKPIPLDTLDKITNIFDIPTQDPDRKNIVSYQGIREWEYGQRFATTANLLESSKNIMVYDREDMDWQGNHTGWGKDVFRIPTSKFAIKTYSGKTLDSPKGMFFETYTNPWNEKTSIHDNNLVQRYFFQTVGDSVNVFSYDPQSGLYREDGRISKGFLDEASKGKNILLTDLIASDPAIKWGTDPDYSTEDHLVGVKLVGVNDEELKLMYVRELDDAYAKEHYGVVND